MSGVPEYSLETLPPKKMRIDIIGSAIEGGRTQEGFGRAIDYSGGGMWKVEYQDVIFQSPAAHRYYQALRNRLNGGTRSVVVPLLTDWVAPVAPGEDLWLNGIPHDDGSLFSDLTGYRQSTITAEVAEDAAQAAGTVKIRLLNGGDLAGGETFSIYHAVKNHRAYSIPLGDIDDIETEVGGATVYTIGIRPTLREAIVAGQNVEFARPRCLMRLPAGSTLPWEVGSRWISQISIPFIEAF